MKFFLRNSSGFSMVQGLIIAGIIAGSSLVTTQLMNDQKKAQKTAEVKDKLEEFHQTLYSTLQHKQNCKPMFENNDCEYNQRADADFDHVSLDWYNVQVKYKRL